MNIHSEEPRDDLTELFAVLKAGQPSAPTRDELDAAFASAKAMAEAAETDPALADELDRLVQAALADLARRNSDPGPAGHNSSTDDAGRSTGTDAAGSGSPKARPSVAGHGNRTHQPDLAAFLRNARVRSDQAASPNRRRPCITADLSATETSCRTPSHEYSHLLTKLASGPGTSMRAQNFIGRMYADLEQTRQWLLQELQRNLSDLRDGLLQETKREISHLRSSLLQETKREIAHLRSSLLQETHREIAHLREHLLHQMREELTTLYHDLGDALRREAAQVRATLVEQGRNTPAEPHGQWHVDTGWEEQQLRDRPHARPAQEHQRPFPTTPTDRSEINPSPGEDLTRCSNDAPVPGQESGRQLIAVTSCLAAAAGGAGRERAPYLWLVYDEWLPLLHSHTAPTRSFVRDLPLNRLRRESKLWFLGSMRAAEPEDSARYVERCMRSGLSRVPDRMLLAIWPATPSPDREQNSRMPLPRSPLDLLRSWMTHSTSAIPSATSTWRAGEAFRTLPVAPGAPTLIRIGSHGTASGWTDSNPDSIHAAKESDARTGLRHHARHNAVTNAQNLQEELTHVLRAHAAHDRQATGVDHPAVALAILALGGSTAVDTLAALDDAPAPALNEVIQQLEAEELAEAGEPARAAARPSASQPEGKRLVRHIRKKKEQEKRTRRESSSPRRR